MKLSVTLSYDGCCTDAETRKVGMRWLDTVWKLGENKAKLTVTRSDEVTYSAPTWEHTDKLREWLVEQPECAVVEEKIAKAATRRKNGPAIEHWRKRRVRE